jgi:hypothetical protein
VARVQLTRFNGGGSSEFNGDDADIGSVKGDDVSPKRWWLRFNSVRQCLSQEAVAKVQLGPAESHQQNNRARAERSNRRE